eukprot:g4478.t1 g4478   contig15:1108107-1108448(-)
MVVGDGRLQAAVDMPEDAYKTALDAAMERSKAGKEGKTTGLDEEEEDDNDGGPSKRKRVSSVDNGKSDDSAKKPSAASIGSYSAAEASSAYDHLSKFHQEKGWDKSGWWARKG